MFSAPSRTRRLTPCLIALWLGAASGEPPLEDVTDRSGVDFVHFNGMSGALYLPEIMGPGAALLDFDGDGDLDLFLPQGDLLGPAGERTAPRSAPPASVSRGDRLYRNDSSPESGIRFTEVSALLRARQPGYGMGAATGDFDRDGRVDLYLTRFGVNRLLRNTGQGFEDVTERAGVGDPSWSVSAAFLDFDRDGRLDLYVGNYVVLDLADHKGCRAPSSAPDYCTPAVYRDQPDRLYRNLGDGRFEDVSQRAGIAGAAAPALGVLVLDANADGWPDVYVANDSKPNQLWINRRDGTFGDDALFAGVAVNMTGAAEGSMGVVCGDLDGDGDDDLFVTHLTGETNTLYSNDGKGWFEDRSIVSGVGAPSKGSTGFGTGILDLDNDGRLDLFVANGEVSLARAVENRDEPFPLGQADQLFVNRGAGGFADISATAGPYFQRRDIGRGLALGDLDNDGDTDLVVANNNGRARVLANRVGSEAAWIGLDLREVGSAPALGAEVELVFPDGAVVRRRVHSDGSYASAGDPRVVIGLGMHGAPVRARVQWPDGRSEIWEDPPPRRYSVLRRGAGSKPPDLPSPSPPAPGAGDRQSTAGQIRNPEMTLPVAVGKKGLEQLEGGPGGITVHR
jgi:hypothetical protein